MLPTLLITLMSHLVKSPQSTPKPKGGPFSRLPKKWHPLAEEKVALYRQRFIDRHGHPPNPGQYGMMMGWAVSVIRNHYIRDTGWKAASQKVLARKRRENRLTR